MIHEILDVPHLKDNLKAFTYLWQGNDLRSWQPANMPLPADGKVDLSTPVLDRGLCSVVDHLFDLFLIALRHQRALNRHYDESPAIEHSLAHTNRRISVSPYIWDQ